MNYLGVNIGGHDSSVCLLELQNNRISEVNIYLSERFTKVKHQGNFPYHGLGQLYREYPSLQNELQPEHVATNSFRFHPYQLERDWGEHHFDLIELRGFQKASMLFNDKLSFITHHLCHAYSALFQCPFSKALVIVSDGTGNQVRNFPQHHVEKELLSPDPDEFEYLSVYLLEDGKLTPVEKYFMKYSPTASDKIFVSKGLGVLFETAGRLIFDDWTTAGKVMGLAHYGKAENINDPVTYLQEKIKNPLKPFNSKKDFDGQSQMEFTEKANLGATIQTYFEVKMLELLKKYKIQFPEFDNLVLVGGCALNCLLNARVISEGIYSHVFVPPFPNDEGIALGGAIALAARNDDYKFKPTTFSDMTAALGSRQHDTRANEHKVTKVFSDFTVIQPPNLTDYIAQKISSHEIVAWIQGRSEVGPRALGNRSILARPDSPDMKQRLNDTIKFREAFRPYGATVIQEEVSRFFDVASDYQSPFMTFSPQVKEEWKGKLKSVTHVDGSSRIQTLMREQNPVFYDLLKSVQARTGLPILLNTSLNIMGQPILESIEDAFKFFTETNITTMVYGSFVIHKGSA